jgi:hypothetical protein
MASLPDTGDLSAPAEEVGGDVKMGGIQEGKVELKGATGDGKAAQGGKKKKKGKK